MLNVPECRRVGRLRRLALEDDEFVAVERMDGDPSIAEAVDDAVSLVAVVDKHGDGLGGWCPP